MKIAGLIVELSSERTLACWMRNAWMSFAALHFVGWQKTPEWNCAAQKRTAQERFAELPERLSKTAGSKFDEGCLKLTSAPQLCSAGLSAAAAAGQLGQGVHRSVPQSSVRHRFAVQREVVQEKDLMLLQLHFRSPRLRPLSGCGRPSSAPVSSCSHFGTACSELSGCKSLIQQRYFRVISFTARILVSFLFRLNLPS